MDAEEHILSELKDGAKLSDVYNSTVAMVKKEKPDLVTTFTFLYHVEQLFRANTVGIRISHTFVWYSNMSRRVSAPHTINLQIIKLS